MAECTQEAKTRVIENEDGTTREIYVPKEIDDANLFEQGINSGINFDKFDKIAVRKFCLPLTVPMFEARFFLVRSTAAATMCPSR